MCEVVSSPRAAGRGGGTYVMSSVSGDYTLPNLVAGNHQIRVAYPEGWAETDPGMEVANVTVADGDRLADKLRVVRSMTANIGTHAEASYFMRTAYKPIATLYHPMLGAYAQSVLGPAA
ncbi:MAG: DUF1501 domain-containing protein [Phycisphaera sp.]|nr:DUF1501 domain-containing protein [Phycisphaera sp.]